MLALQKKEETWSIAVLDKRSFPVFGLLHFLFVRTVKRVGINMKHNCKRNFCQFYNQFFDGFQELYQSSAHLSLQALKSTKFLLIVVNCKDYKIARSLTSEKCQHS